jgi:ribosomal-protein-alanine N-acetyltransferase
VSEGFGRAVTIGLAELARDLDGILAVDAATFTNPTTREAYEWEAQNSDVARLWVARAERAESDVVAYCAAWLIFDELHINNLAVHPQWRREGVARRLLTYVLAAADGAGAVRATLEVRMSNEPARRLYERFGFREAGTRPAYYRDPVEDALILWRGPARGPGPGA